MFDGARVLVVVPARGGSKGVKLKNLRRIGGVSLVALAGRVAAGLDFADRAIVSTDHTGIADEARAHGLEVPFLRPPDISGSIVSDWQVLSHAHEEMERLDQTTYDIIIMLQPTSPGRTPDHVRQCIAHLVSGGFDAVWTVSETDSKAHPLKQLTISGSGSLDYYDPAGAAIIARQQLKPVYHRNGIAYAITRQCLIEQKSIMGKKPGAVIIAGPLANIDTEFDLELANYAHARNKERTPL